MQLTIKMDCNNAAFVEPQYEISRILNRLAKRIEGESDLEGDYPLCDINGNRVGKCTINE